MTLLQIPDTYRRFLLERDEYRELWIAFAIVGDFWYKGQGPVIEDAKADLDRKIAAQQHIGQPIRATIYKGKTVFGGTSTPPLLAGINIGELDL